MTLQNLLSQCDDATQHTFTQGRMHQFTQPLWWPFSFRLGSPNGFAWCKLPANLYISWNLEPDWSERVVWEHGLINVTRPETAEEKRERFYAEEEAAYEDHCRSFYSY